MLLALVALAAGWIHLKRGADTPEASSSPPSVLAAIPRGAMLVAVVDVAALRATALGQQLFGEGRSIAGLGEIQAICGRDPMADVVQLALAVPTELNSGFGVFAAGRLDAEQLMACAAKIVERRGGKPVRSPVNGFFVLRDASGELSSAELAARDGGPLVLAEAEYVRASLELAPGSEESALRDPEHLALRSLVVPGEITATVVLSGEQRRALADELRAQEQPDSPFSALSAGALSVQVGQRLEAHAVLRCDRADACAAVAAHIDSALREEARSLSARAVGLTEVLDQLTIRTDGQAVHLRLGVGLEQAVALVRRVMTLRQLAEQVEHSPDEPAAPDPPDPGPPDPQAAPADRGSQPGLAPPGSSNVAPKARDEHHVRGGKGAQAP
jgi:hypothetical protein